jgi:hypothetical protein
VNITSKCRCGAEFNITYSEGSTIHAEYRFKDWLALHTECPSKHFAGHIPFKTLLTRAQLR